MRLGAFLFTAILISACPSDPDNTIVDSGGNEPPDAGAADSGRPDLPPPPEVCPRPAGDITIGDVNGDGVVDVADPIAFENYLFLDGPEPVCRKAADTTNDGLIELDDATLIVSYLVPGTGKLRDFDPNDCNQLNPWPEGQCAPLALDIDAPDRVTGERFSAKLAIRSPTLAVQGWSMSIRALDCSIVDATTDGTTAAEIWDDPPGIRHLGYSAAVRVIEGAIAYVTLSVTSEVTLPPSEEQTVILALEVEHLVAGSGCKQCMLSVGDGLQWTGQPIDAVIVAAGYAYEPNVPTKTIEFCSP